MIPRIEFFLVDESGFHSETNNMVNIPDSSIDA